MIGVVYAREMRDAADSWAGLAAVAAATTLTAFVPAALLATATQHDGVLRLGLLSLGGTVGALWAIGALAVMPAAVRAIAQVRQPALSLLQRVGMAPTLVAGAFFAGAVVSVTLGAAVGLLVGPPVSRAFVGFGLTGTTGIGVAEVALPPAVAIGTAGGVSVFALLVAARVAARVSRFGPTSPEASGETRHGGRALWARLTVSLALALLSVIMVASLGRNSSSSNAVLFAGPLLIASLAVSGGPLVVVCERAWLRVFRPRVLFLLARGSATSSYTRNDGLASTTFLAVGLPSALDAGARLASANAAAPAVWLLIGTPTFLAMCSAAVGYATTVAQRSAERETLRRLGLGVREIVGVTVIETALHLPTVAALVVLAVAVLSVIEASLLGVAVIMSVEVFAVSTLLTATLVTAAAALAARS